MPNPPYYFGLGAQIQLTLHLPADEFHTARTSVLQKDRSEGITFPHGSQILKDRAPHASLSMKPPPPQPSSLYAQRLQKKKKLLRESTQERRQSDVLALAGTGRGRYRASPDATVVVGNVGKLRRKKRP